MLSIVYIIATCYRPSHSLQTQILSPFFAKAMFSSMRLCETLDFNLDFVCCSFRFNHCHRFVEFCAQRQTAGSHATVGQQGDDAGGDQAVPKDHHTIRPGSHGRSVVGKKKTKNLVLDKNNTVLFIQNVVK